MQLLGGKIARWEILDFIRHEGRNQVIIFLEKSISGGPNIIKVTVFGS